jgi:uncharacterized membrane protein
MTPKQWGLLSLLAVLWGGAFFFSKVALGELRPFTVVLVRFGVAALAMQLVVRLTGRRMPRSLRIWAGFVVLGALNNFVPFSLIAWGQVHIGSGLASILNATTPLFTAVVAHAWGQERLSAHRVAGVLLGLVGVAVLIGPGALQHLGAATWGELAIVGAAVSYAFAGTYGRRFRAMPAVVGGGHAHDVRADGATDRARAGPAVGRAPERGRGRRAARARAAQHRARLPHLLPAALLRRRHQRDAGHAADPGDRAVPGLADPARAGGGRRARRNGADLRRAPRHRRAALAARDRD